MRQLLVDDEDHVRPVVKYGLAAVMVVLVAYFAYAAWRKDSRSLPVVLKCMTDGCTYERERPLGVGEILPLPCPKCGRNSVVLAFTCSQCGTANIWNEDRGLKPPTKCRKCGKEAYHGG